VLKIGEHEFLKNINIGGNIQHISFYQFWFPHKFWAEGVMLGLLPLLCPWVRIYQTTWCHPSVQYANRN
jgi:hypothetical protein